MAVFCLMLSEDIQPADPDCPRVNKTELTVFPAVPRFLDRIHKHWGLEFPLSLGEESDPSQASKHN